MARIRSIKPEFAHDEMLAAMPRDVRLLFVLLWPIADDEGRFRSHAALVKAECFPYDDDISADKVEAWLQVLARAKRIRLYEVDGQRYGVVVNFLKHQKINRPSMSRLPKPPPDKPLPPSTNGTQGSLTESSVSPHSGIGSGIGSGMEGKGRDQEGSAEGRADALAAGASEAPASARREPDRNCKRCRGSGSTLGTGEDDWQQPVPCACIRPPPLRALRACSPPRPPGPRAFANPRRRALMREGE